MDYVPGTDLGQFWMKDGNGRKLRNETPALPNRSVAFKLVADSLHSGEELDIKPYEADMRHLLNTYLQADPANDLGNLSALPLTEVQAVGAKALSR